MLKLWDGKKELKKHMEDSFEFFSIPRYFTHLFTILILRQVPVFPKMFLSWLNVITRYHLK